jgi:hypothetical protein
LFVNLGATGWHFQGGGTLPGAGARGDGERRVVLACDRDSCGRGDALRNPSLIFLFIQDPVGLGTAICRVNGNKKDSGNGAGEDSDDQTELIAELAIVGYAHAVKYELAAVWKPNPNRHAACFVLDAAMR